MFLWRGLKPAAILTAFSVLSEKSKGETNAKAADDKPPTGPVPKRPATAEPA